jgi:ADP-heptose:LPS heptosyltransferase
MSSTPSHVAIFEPWGLGDLCVALVAARALSRQGVTVTVVCAPAWKNWVDTLSYVNHTVSIRIPWTAKQGKYNPVRYRISEFRNLRRTLRDLEVDVFCEQRGDIRNVTVMKMMKVAPVHHLRGREFDNRYDRPVHLVESLLASVEPEIAPDPRGMGLSEEVVCFFGAAWVNRRLPEGKAREVVQRLLDDKRPVALILPPDESSDNWEAMVAAAEGRLELLQGEVAGIADRLSKAALCVSTDSGWLHVAHLFGVPSVALYGFTNASEWAPPSSRVVFAEETQSREVMHDLSRESIQPLESLSVDAVAAAVDQIELSH